MRSELIAGIDSRTPGEVSCGGREHCAVQTPTKLTRCVAYSLLVAAEDVVVIAASHTEPERKDVSRVRGTSIVQPGLFTVSVSVWSECALGTRVLRV